MEHRLLQRVRWPEGDKPALPVVVLVESPLAGTGKLQRGLGSEDWLSGQHRERDMERSLRPAHLEDQEMEYDERWRDMPWGAGTTWEPR